MQAQENYVRKAAGKAETVSACYETEEKSAPAIMLGVRLLNGHSHGLPYHCLLSMVYEPQGLLTLSFNTWLLKIKGRNLLKIYELLLAHRISMLVESSERYDTALENEPFIAEITVKELSNTP